MRADDSRTRSCESRTCYRQASIVRAILLVLAALPTRGLVTPGSSSLFPEDRGRKASSSLRVGEADIPGKWMITDRLAAQESVDAAKTAMPPEVGQRSAYASSSVLLGIGGNVLRSTLTTFATGSWRLFAADASDGAPAYLEIEIASKLRRQRLLYRGVVAFAGGGGSLFDDEGLPLSVEEQLISLSATGFVEHLETMGGDEDTACDPDAPLGWEDVAQSQDVAPGGAEVALDPRSPRSYAGNFHMVRTVSLGGGVGGDDPGDTAKPQYICTVGARPWKSF